MYYETRFGQSVAVVGSTKELGAWKEYKCKLIWTKGHIWKSEVPFEVSESVFQYKYVLVEEDGSIQWEIGINRIADLNILPNF